jgi:hypothetical protein
MSTSAAKRRRPSGTNKEVPDFDSLRKERQAQRTRDALNARREGQPLVAIATDPENPNTEFLYVERVLTTRSGDRDQVLAELADLSIEVATVAEDAPIPGVVTVTLGSGVDVVEVCRQLDPRVGLGAAMPMGVVHITPTGLCPATEPVPAQGDPVPPPTSTWAAGAGVEVVVIDTGRRRDVELDHPWLGFITGDEEQREVGHYQGHGTFVCGVLRGAAPFAEIDVNGVLIDLGAAVENDMALELWRAITQDQPQIISMSAGTTSRDGLPPVVLAVLAEHLQANEVLLVASAGNDGNDHPFYPAYFSVADARVNRAANPYVVSVGALAVDETRAPYSNHTWPVVYARGSGVVNAYPRGQYDYEEEPMLGRHAHFDDGMASWDGTSFSTPLVAGLIVAHMTRRGEDAVTARDHLLTRAAAQRDPLIGPILRPGDAGTGM